MPRGLDGCLGHRLAQQAVARDVEHVAALHPGRSSSDGSSSEATPRSEAMVRCPWSSRTRNDHAAGALHDRTANLDAVPFELGRGQLAGDVVPRLQISRLRAPRAPAHAATFAAWPPAMKRIVAGVSASGASGPSGRTMTSRIRSPIVQIMRQGRVASVATHARAIRYGAAVGSARRRIVLSDTVARAVRDGDPVVALESTIITHGLPRPRTSRPRSSSSGSSPAAARRRRRSRCSTGCPRRARGR